MIIPTKKLQNGFEMPVFGLGTWMMGGTTERDPNNDDQADISAIKTAIDMGITHIDTAEKYANGKAEELVGKAIQGYKRKNLFLVSKVAEYNLTYTKLIQAAKSTLERMQTDYLDLYLIHGPSNETPIEESMRAMNDLVDAGLVKHIGVSNFNINRLQEAQKVSIHPIVANQLHYNVQIREIESKGILEYSQENDIMIIAWRPLQKGMLLNGKNKLLDDIGKKYEKTPAQVAINWLISQNNVVTLSKMSSAKHIKENLGALYWEMREEDIEKIRNEFPNQKTVSEAVPLV